MSEGKRFTTSRSIPWKACAECGKPINGEAVIEEPGTIPRHKKCHDDLQAEHQRSREDYEDMKAEGNGKGGAA